MTPFAATAPRHARARAQRRAISASPLTGLVVLGSNGEARAARRRRSRPRDQDRSRRDAEGSAAARRHRPRIDRGHDRRDQARRRSRRRRRAGAHAVVLQGPDDDRRVRASLHAGRRSIPVPVLLYNVTMYTGVNLLPDAVGILSRHPNIVGMKESDSDMVQIGEYLAKAEEGFTVLAGSRRDLLLRARARRARRHPRPRRRRAASCASRSSTPFATGASRRRGRLHRQLTPLARSGRRAVRRAWTEGGPRPCAATTAACRVRRCGRRRQPRSIRSATQLAELNLLEPTHAAR